MNNQERFNEFIQKVLQLRKEYGVVLDYGCGCCGDGAWINCSTQDPENIRAGRPDKEVTGHWDIIRTKLEDIE